MPFIFTVPRKGLAVALLLLGTSAIGQVGQTPINTPPSAMPLRDYEETVLYPWLKERRYARPELGWKQDSRIRDTGPYIRENYYGTHPAVRIYYSKEVTDWLDGGRNGEIGAGAIIVKEMFLPPAAIYNETLDLPWFAEHPDEREELLAELLDGWAVMIKDPAGGSKDGWFWSSPGNKPTLADMLDPAAGNVDDYSHVLTSSFGSGTCIRCHASAADENTFSSLTNISPDASPLQFRVDNSWRTTDHLGSAFDTIKSRLEQWDVPGHEELLVKLDLARQQRPWEDSSLPDYDEYLNLHTPRRADATGLASAGRRPGIDADFVANFERFTELVDHRVDDEEVRRFSFPFEFADHVPPTPAIERGGTDNPNQYITSSNCYGCHGGLGGSPYAVTMFVKTGPGYGDGYNISEFGEWRWSPMGLAGRDPVFHAQLESELILLLKENSQLRDGRPATGSTRTTQQALVDTCLRCHGAMGLRQKGIDQGGDILNPHFDPDFFYLEEPLTAAQAENPTFRPSSRTPNPPSGLTPAEFYDSYKLGNLAREGISCTVCHHIAPPDAEVAATWVEESSEAYPGWFGADSDQVWSKSFFYFLANNTTGLYRRNEANELYGPFDDIQVTPMENALGTTPTLAPSMHHDTNFTSDSAMCGTCHTINLPNLGAPVDENPILTALEPNPAFQGIPHSIEQATYLEWLNSSFGLGAENEKGEKFQSCQDCHMPNRFATLEKNADGTRTVDIPELASQIATIQDSAYPQAEHQLPLDELEITTRADYRRHELVGLNAFMVEMFKQFPEVLGVSPNDYETGADNGADLAIENMVLSAEEGRVATLALDAVTVDDEHLTVDVTVVNKTGHRFPSGVTFRRAFVELVVLDGDGDVIWSSGRTNSAGVIVDNQGAPLETEFLNERSSPADRVAQYQPHHQTITSDRQVQIYEELITNAEDAFTTSFIHRVHHIKDNRLLPEGWVDSRIFAGTAPDGAIGPQGELLLEFMESTDPEGASVVGGTGPNGRSFRADPEYTTSPAAGSDRLRYQIARADLNGTPVQVQATVYSQALMPAWFFERFSLANDAKAAGYDTPALDRLFYLSSRLNLEGTVLEGWKLAVARACWSSASPTSCPPDN